MGRISLFYVRLISMGFKQRFMLANLTKVPVIRSAIERAFFEGDRMLILPKDGVAKAASEKVVTAEVAISAEQKDLVVPSKVLEEFIRRSKHHFIMGSVAKLGCGSSRRSLLATRSIRLRPCALLRVVEDHHHVMLERAGVEP